MKAIDKVRAALRELGEATRPQLAAATGLSLVSCNQAMAELCRLGEAQEMGIIPSGGGRPVLQYRLNARHAYTAYFKAERKGSLISVSLEVCDLNGTCLHAYQAEFAYLGKESLDAWLDSRRISHKLHRISLEIPPDILPAGLETHLESRYHCSARILNTADALADHEEDTLTLYIQQGQNPVCTLRRGGSHIHSGPLGLLPLPASWLTLDYSDHTLVEEMLARLITMLACTLAPSRFVLFADFWTPRLIKRVHFNVSSKLQQDTLHLHFRNISPAHAASKLRDFACKA